MDSEGEDNTSISKETSQEKEPERRSGRQTRGIKKSYSLYLDIGSASESDQNDNGNDEDFDPEKFDERVLANEKEVEKDADWCPSSSEESVVEESDEPTEEEFSDEEEEKAQLTARDAIVTSFSENPEEEYACSKCFKRFDSKSDASEHVQEHNFPIVCSDCPVRFRTGGGLSQHFKLVHTEKHFCSECMFSTKVYGELLAHKRKNHKSMKARKYPNMCHVCAQCYGSSTYLHVHLYKEHQVGDPPEKNHVCETCGKRFVFSRELRTHMVTHMEKTIKCKYKGCTQTYVLESSMKKHYNSCHLGYRSIVCNYEGCQLTFKSYRVREEHINMVHLKVRSIHCTWPGCNKSFFANKHLLVHMRIHSDEKPLKCDHCDYRCRQRTALNWHLKKHGIFKEAQTRDYESEKVLLEGRKGKPGRKAKTDGKSRSIYQKKSVEDQEMDTEKRDAVKTKSKRERKRSIKSKSFSGSKKSSQSYLEALKEGVELLEKQKSRETHEEESADIDKLSREKVLDTNLNENGHSDVNIDVSLLKTRTDMKFIHGTADNSFGTSQCNNAANFIERNLTQTNLEHQQSVSVVPRSKPAHYQIPKDPCGSPIRSSEFPSNSMFDPQTAPLLSLNSGMFHQNPQGPFSPYPSDLYNPQNTQSVVRPFSEQHDNVPMPTTMNMYSGSCPPQLVPNNTLYQQQHSEFRQTLGSPFNPDYSIDPNLYSSQQHPSAINQNNHNIYRKFC